MTRLLVVGHHEQALRREVVLRDHHRRPDHRRVHADYVRVVEDHDRDLGQVEGVCSIQTLEEPPKVPLRRDLPRDPDRLSDRHVLRLTIGCDRRRGASVTVADDIAPTDPGPAGPRFPNGDELAARRASKHRRAGAGPGRVPRR